MKHGPNTSPRKKGSSFARTAQRKWSPLKKASPSAHSTHKDLLVQNVKIWTPTGLRHGSILIENGKISKIARRILPTKSPRIDGGGFIALPGLVDTHVHLRGLKLSYKEDFATGTAAAAAGGFTTVLDMPNTIPPTDTQERLTAKMKEASGQVVVNVGFHVAAVNDSTAIRDMTKGGAFSLKLYLPKPISPLAVESEDEVQRLMRNAFDANIPITIHAEDPDEFKATNSVRSILDKAKSRPPTAETHAISKILSLRKTSQPHLHFCHISLPESLNSIRHAAMATSEVTPHHILLTNKMLKRRGWKAWMVPPLRSEAERTRLLSATATGQADIIATDHAPHTVREKMRPPAESPPGIPGLETALSLMMTLASKRMLSLRRIVSCMSRNPAQIFGLSGKGLIARGCDGDIVLVDPKRRGVIRPELFHSKAKYSPFEGWKTTGQVQATIVGGQVAYEKERVLAKPGTGMILKRNE